MLHKVALLFLGLLWLFWLFPAAALPEDDKKLFPVCQGGKYGFIDQSALPDAASAKRCHGCKPMTEPKIKLS